MVCFQTRGYSTSSGAFGWKNCDMSGFPLTFTKISMLPDPLQMTGDTSVIITYTMGFNLTVELGADSNQIEVKFTVYLHWYLKFPFDWVICVFTIFWIVQHLVISPKWCESNRFKHLIFLCVQYLNNEYIHTYNFSNDLGRSIFSLKTTKSLALSCYKQNISMTELKWGNCSDQA